MSGLDKHFGENASLDAPLAASLGAWLANSSAEKFDTLPANLFRTINPAEPMRITATNGWKRMHHELDSAIFSTKPVGSRINCANCHHDAATGRLYPADIGIPVRSP